jgi:hypothetical protein
MKATRRSVLDVDTPCHLRGGVTSSAIIHVLLSVITKVFLEIMLMGRTQKSNVLIAAQ